MTSRQPIGKREAAPHAAAKVGGSDISFRKSQKHDTQQAGPQPPLHCALFIGGGGGGVPGRGGCKRGLGGDIDSKQYTKNAMQFRYMFILLWLLPP